MLGAEPKLMASLQTQTLVFPEVLRVGGPTLAQRLYRVLRENPVRLRRMTRDSAQYLRFYRVLNGIGGKEGYQGTLNVEDVIYFCRKFNVNLMWLLFGIGEPYNGHLEARIGEDDATYPGYRGVIRRLRQRF